MVEAWTRGKASNAKAYGEDGKRWPPFGDHSACAECKATRKGAALTSLDSVRFRKKELRGVIAGMIRALPRLFGAPRCVNYSPQVLPTPAVDDAQAPPVHTAAHHWPFRPHS